MKSSVLSHVSFLRGERGYTKPSLFIAVEIGIDRNTLVKEPPQSTNWRGEERERKAKKRERERQRGSIGEKKRKKLEQQESES